MLGLIKCVFGGGGVAANSNYRWSWGGGAERGMEEERDGQRERENRRMKQWFVLFLWVPIDFWDWPMFSYICSSLLRWESTISKWRKKHLVPNCPQIVCATQGNIGSLSVSVYLSSILCHFIMFNTRQHKFSLCVSLSQFNSMSLYWHGSQPKVLPKVQNDNYKKLLA